jgi:hypothetical protein
MLGPWQAVQSAERAKPPSATWESGSVIVLPRLDHPRAGLSPPAWRRLSPREKLERLFGLSLDRMAEVLSWPAGELDPVQLNAQVTVARVVAMIGGRAGLLEQRRQVSQAERKAREELARRLGGYESEA